ncbi:MAG: hypothetical protein MUF48_10605 [Pirellulaceae bacterium]|jgi:hypothetical protein|nr:hypothetical protein [Pirellulaceae bacterium]
MKLSMGAVALGVLLSVGARAGERAPVQRDTGAPVSALEVAASLPGGTLPWTSAYADVCQGPAGWGQLRHGDLWTDYCESAPCAVSPTPGPPRRTWWPWAAGHAGGPQRCQAAGCTRCVPFGRLYQLLGWQPRWWRPAACTHRVCAQVPRASYRVDDHDPAPPPSPPVPAPRELDVSPPSPGADAAPLPADPPVLTAPLPSDTVPAEQTPAAPPTPATPPDPLPDELDSAPAPTDDPAPEPQLDIPRNKLPALKRAPADMRTPYRPTAVAGRLSDFIRVR